MSAVKDALAKGFNTFHRNLYKLSGGKILGRAGGMPVVMLHHVGRKSGEERTTMLTTPLQMGDDIVIVASYGGDDRDPAWFLNLQAKPDVEVTFENERRPVRARVAGDEERTQLWSELTADHKNYANYQHNTDRIIPVVVLEPR